MEPTSQQPINQDIIQPVENIQPKRNWYKYGFWGLVILMILYLPIYFYFSTPRTFWNDYRHGGNITIGPIPSPTSMPNPSPTPLSNIPSDWKTWNTPIEAYYPFQINYPANWIAKLEQDIDNPWDIRVTLTNTRNETIIISQGVGDGGNCVYSDEPDYTSFEGVGNIYPWYIQLNKPADWRVGGVKNSDGVYVNVCEKTKIRYIDTTRIGRINIGLKSDTSLQEVISILEKIIINTPSKANPTFD